MEETTPPNGSADEFAVPGARYRSLVEHVPAVVYIASHSTQDQALYISPQVSEILGYTPEEFQSDAALWPRTLHPHDRRRVVFEWERAVELERPFRVEYRILAKDGRIVWVRDHATLVRDGAGRPHLWEGVMQDISDRKRAERAEQVSEARYRALVERVPAVLYEMGRDDDRRAFYISRHVERFLGYSRDEWLDQPDIWTELLHPDDREVELAAHDLHNQTGAPWSREYRLIANDGRVVWVLDEAVLVQDDDGGPFTWHGVMIDITPQKEMEENLRHANDDLELRVLERTSELAEANEMMALEIGERRRVEDDLRRAQERYRLLVERIPATIYVWHISTGIDDEPSREYWSPRIQELVGFTSEEWQRAWPERLHPHDRERVLAAAQRCRETGEPFEEEYRCFARDGHLVWVLDRASLLTRDPAGRPKLYQGVVLDITERKAAQAKALDAESRYRALAEQGPVIAYTWERTTVNGFGPFTYVSPQIEDLLGYPVELLRSSRDFWASILHPDDLEKSLAVDRHIELTGEPWSTEYRILAADGRIVWLHDEGHLLSRDERGRPQSFHGILMDITERKHAAERLRDAEAVHRTIVESLPGIPFIAHVDSVTHEEEVVYLGPQVEAILGWTPDELLAERDHVRRLLHPDDLERVERESARSNRTGRPRDIEYRVLARDGHIVWLHTRSELVGAEPGRPRVWHGISMDVTERRLAEEPRLVADLGERAGA